MPKLHHIHYVYQFEGMPRITIKDWTIVTQIEFIDGQRFSNEVLTACLDWASDERMRIAEGQPTTVVI